MTDAGCKFRAWTDDAEGQSGESFTMTITKDTDCLLYTSIKLSEILQKPYHSDAKDRKQCCAYPS